MHPSPNQEIKLRDRKKIQLKRQIKQKAMTLFIRHGYIHTTINQIAEAINISPRTVFRYYPTKEALLFEDEYDSTLSQVFRGQSTQLSIIDALIQSLTQTFQNLSVEQIAYEQQKHAIISSTPELQTLANHEAAKNLDLLISLIAERVKKDAADPDIRTFAAAIQGVLLASQLQAYGQNNSNMLAAMTSGLQNLEKLLGKGGI
jgi:AcrR family transcriptional regulator